MLLRFSTPGASHDGLYNRWRNVVVQAGAGPRHHDLADADHPVPSRHRRRQGQHGIVLARGQHAVGFIAGQSPITGIEPILTRISPFLAASAGLAVLVGSRENGLRIRGRLEQLGFRIEAGVRCKAGLVLSAYRQGYIDIKQAA